MRRVLLPLLAVLLTACVTQPQPVPDTWPKRYRAFIQEVNLPLGSRFSRYLGPIADRPPGDIGTEEALNIRFAPTNAVSGVTVRFDTVLNGVYAGRMWTQFNRKVTCVSLKQLSEVGQYQPGYPYPVHGYGRENVFGVVRLESTPDKFILFLEGGARLEADPYFVDGCLDRLEHSVASGKLEW